MVEVSGSNPFAPTNFPQYPTLWNRSINKLNPFLILFTLIIGLPVLFWPTFNSMINTWIADETFTHGFLIFPITLWLIWKKRKELSLAAAVPEPRVLVLLALVALGWFVGNIVDVKVVQQFGLIAMIIVSIWAVLGRGILQALMFPLLFLLFAVPFGKVLIPPMMEFTADFTVYAIQLTGIPIYRDGLYFNLPTGNWSVVEACSGVRYLIASLSLGVIYAYISYASLKKRLIFIGFAILVPIIANGIRAYGIVMIGHLSGMELAVGVDHLLYGWVFFGVVIFSMFLVGARWMDPETEMALTTPATSNHELTVMTRTPTVLGACLLVVISPLLYSLYLSSNVTNTAGSIEISLAENYTEWQSDSSYSLDWQPTLLEPDSYASTTYRFGDSFVQLALAYYHRQRDGFEVVNSGNRIPETYEGEWRMTFNTDVQEPNNYVTETEIIKANRKLLVWSWYRIGQYETPKPYIAKVLEAFNKMTSGRTDGTWITLATPLENDKEYSRRQLREFWAQAREGVIDEVESTYSRVAGQQ